MIISVKLQYFFTYKLYGLLDVLDLNARRVKWRRGFSWRPVLMTSKLTPTASISRYSHFKKITFLTVHEKIWVTPTLLESVFKSGSNLTDMGMSRLAHCKCTVPKIRDKYSQKLNWAALFQIFICERFIHSHDRSVKKVQQNRKTDRGNI